jgi:hypothetical protein
VIVDQDGIPAVDEAATHAVRGGEGGDR